MKVIPKLLEGNKLTRDLKIDVLSNTYYKNQFYDSENPYPIYTRELLSGLPDIYLDPIYESTQKYSSNYVHSPSGLGPVIEGYRPLSLRTWYPLVHPLYDSKKDKDYKWTGHSALGFITKHMGDKGYNFVFNNCSDETRRALEAVFNKKLNPFIFTTPGDVRDFAIENGGYSKNGKSRTVYIPMDKERHERYHLYVDSLLKNRKEERKRK